MKPETMIALAKLLEKAAKEIVLVPGQYDIKETITMDVEASINKMDDERYVPTVTIPWKKVVALLLKRAGATRAAIKDLIQTCIIQAVREGADLGTLIESEIDEIETWENYVQEIVVSGGTKTRSGKTFVKGCVAEAEAVVKKRRAV